VMSPELLAKIRKADVARVRAGQQPPSAAAPPPPQNQPKPVPRGRQPVNPHLLSRDEWYRRQGIDPDKL